MSIESNNDPITENYIDPDDFDVLPDDDSEDEDSEESTGEKFLYGMHDTGNARRLIDRHGDKFRWVPEHGRFYVWEHGRFKPQEDAGLVEAFAEESAESIYVEAERYKGKTKRNWKSWADFSLSHGKINACVSRSKSSPRARTPIGQFDMDPYLLNVKNGTYNLLTGEFKTPHDPNDLLTQVCDVHYDKDAKCDTFEKYLLSSLNGDVELVRFLQQAMGYTLSGLQDEKIFLILYGKSDSGKSMFVEIFERILNEYSHKTPIDTLLENYYGTKRSSIAHFKGKRFVHTSEGKLSQRFNIGLLKEITGGDTLSGEHKYGHEFKFQPTHTLWFSTNERPAIKGADTAVYGRLLPVKFPKQFLDPLKHPDVPEGLRLDRNIKKQIITNELPGVLNWAIKGFQDWLAAGGLAVPASVVQDVEDYKRDMDPLVEVFESYCKLAPKELSEKSKEKEKWVCPEDEFYAAYQHWCKRNGIKWEHTAPALGKILKAKGFTKTQIRRGDKRVMAWVGFRFAEDYKEVFRGMVATDAATPGMHREWGTPDID